MSNFYKNLKGVLASVVHDGGSFDSLLEKVHTHSLLASAEQLPQVILILYVRKVPVPSVYKWDYSVPISYGLCEAFGTVPGSVQYGICL